MAAGLFLLIYRPFKAGEMVEVEGSKGVVEEVTIVNMQMTTTDGVRVIMPNSKVWGAKITNFSMANQRLIEIIVKLPRRDAQKAIEIIHGLLAQDDRILNKPEPAVTVSSLADNAAALTASAWVKPADFQATLHDQYLKVLSALESAGIETV